MTQSPYNRDELMIVDCFSKQVNPILAESRVDFYRLSKEYLKLIWKGYDMNDVIFVSDIAQDFKVVKTIKVSNIIKEMELYLNFVIIIHKQGITICDFVGSQPILVINNLGFELIHEKYIVEKNYFSAWNNDNECFKLTLSGNDSTGILDYSFLMPHAQKISYDDQTGRLEFSKDLDGNIIGFLPVYFSSRMIQNVQAQNQKKD